jgi:hypothetical protein
MHYIAAEVPRSRSGLCGLQSIRDLVFESEDPEHIEQIRWRVFVTFESDWTTSFH